MKNQFMLWPWWLALCVALVVCGCKKNENAAEAKTITLLNVSYDPTRELYDDFNAAFAEHWKAKTNTVVLVKMSHGGSGKQARAVIDGLEADVVTLALAYDIQMLHEKGELVPANWQTLLAHNSSPYTSTCARLERSRVSGDFQSRTNDLCHCGLRKLGQGWGVAESTARVTTYFVVALLGARNIDIIRAGQTAFVPTIAARCSVRQACIRQVGVALAFPVRQSAF